MRYEQIDTLEKILGESQILAIMIMESGILRKAP